MSPEARTMISKSEAAAALGIRMVGLDALLESGEIPIHRRGIRLLIDREDLAKYSRKRGREIYEAQVQRIKSRSSVCSLS